MRLTILAKLTSLRIAVERVREGGWVRDEILSHLSRGDEDGSDNVSCMCIVTTNGASHRRTH